MAERPALDELSRLTRRRESGELICVAPTIEVHVHLQDGRLAWATDSSHAFVFTRYLQEHADLTAQQFRDVLEECRRQRLPLGETLIAWKVVSAEQVLAALRHQLGCALSELARLELAQTVFLARRNEYRHYASQLTFELAEFGELLEASAGPAAPASAGGGIVRQIRSALGEVEWIELREAGTVLDQDPARGSAYVPSQLLSCSVLDGASFVALRAASGTLIGVNLEGGARSLWCQIVNGSNFGAAAAALWAASGFATSDAGGGAPGSPWLLGSGDTPLLRELEDFLARAPVLVAALVAHRHDAGQVYGLGCGAIGAEACTSLIRRRSVALQLSHELLCPRSGEQPSLEELGFRFKAIATAEDDLWCLGAEIDSGPDWSVWLLLPRQINQGLGWAYLNALLRQIKSLSDWWTRAS